MAILCLSPRTSYHIPSPSVKQIVVPDGNNSVFYIDATSWKQVVESLNDKYTTHLDKLEQYEIQFETDGKAYLDICNRIAGLNLKQLTNNELLKFYLEYQEKLFTYSVFTWSAYILNNSVADHATKILDSYIQKSRREIEKQDMLDSLFKPIKQAAVLRLQNEVASHNKEFSRTEFTKLFSKYRWLSCLDLQNKPWTEDQFKEAIEAYKKQSTVNPIPFAEQVQTLNISENDLQYLLMAQKFVFIKDARDDFRRQGVYLVLPFFAEIAKRMGISSDDISYVQSVEVVDFLKEGRVVSPKMVNDRKKGFILYLDSPTHITCIQGKDIPSVLTDLHLANTDNLRDKRILGMVACQGMAKGIVAIIHGIKDLDKVKKGYILVADTTHPDYTVAMRKAAAIVTDEGGITSHAAIVSREFGIPCIVGTKNATKILKDGDNVEVNALKGIVSKLI